MRFVIFLFCILTSFFLKAQSLKEAQLLLDHSDYKNAVNLFETIKSQAEKNNNINDIVTANIGIADSYKDLGAYYKSITLLKENIALLNNAKSTNFLLYAKTHLLIAANYYSLDLLEDYKTECHLFYNYYKKAAPNKEIYKALYYAYLSWYYRLKFSMEKATFYSANALKIYHHNKKDENLIDVYQLYLPYISIIRDSTKKEDWIRSNQLKYGDSLLYYFNKRYPYENVKKTSIISGRTSLNIDSAAHILFISRGNLPIKLGEEHAHLAINDYNKAIAINDSKTSYYNPKTANFNALKGLMYFYLRDYKNAIASYDEGIKRLATLSKNDCEFTLNNLQLLTLFRWKSWCFDEIRKTNPDPKLLYEINTLLSLMEKVWNRYSNELLHTNEQYYSNTYNMVPYPFLMKNNFELYELTKKQNYIEKAAEYDEKSKYLSLLNNINSNQKPKAEAEDKLLTAKKLKAYNSYSDLLLSKSGILSKNKSDFKRDLNSYLEIEKKSGLAKNEIVSIKEIQENLKSNEAVISYTTVRFQGSVYPFIKLIQKDKIKIIQIKTFGESWGEDLIKDSIGIALKNNDIKSYKKLAYRLYTDYFKPIEKEMSKEITHLEIIPNAEFSTISFETLLYEEVQTNDFRKLPYLINKYNFSYSLSSSISKLNNNRKQKETNSTAFFSPSFTGKNLSQLPLSKDKAKSMAIEYEAVFFEGNKATLNDFKTALQNNKTVAVFSHGQSFNDFENEKKGIYLTDQFLNLNAIYDLKSNCDFLILGACETGFGAKENGEGNINLARAFTSIGVKSMLLASWKIDEESTMTITASFLKYLQEGDSKAEALQKAKLDFLKSSNPRTANPYYWAGLNIIGNNENVKPLDKNNHLWFLLLFPLTGGIWYIKKKKKRIKTIPSK